MTWHVLDANSIWIREFASALGSSVAEPVCAWMPDMRLSGAFTGRVWSEVLPDPSLELLHFPLQRGYARFPLSALVRLGPAMSRRLKAQAGDPGRSPLLCTTPYYAPVAECWPGPVVYYQTDLTVAYAGADPALVRRLDRRLCRRADLVCPNSRRISAYFVENGCPPEKVVIVPNATRAANLLPAPAFAPAALPDDVAGLPRPVAGVIGNLAANVDWLFLESLVELTPEFSWLFIGPYAMEIPDPRHRAAREALLARGGRVRFAGPRPYGTLQSYARAFDAAVLPYRKQEPTYSGSSTRFYEHLPACRPMLATRGFEELLHKEPLLALSDEPDEAAALLMSWRERGFRDGQEQARWEASQSGTWEVRASTMTGALAERLERRGNASSDSSSDASSDSSSDSGSDSSSDSSNRAARRNQPAGAFPRARTA